MLSVEIANILAICVLATVVAALAGWMVMILRRSPFTPVQSALYALNYAIVRILWRTKIHGADFPPARTGGGPRLQPPLPAGPFVPDERSAQGHPLAGRQGVLRVSRLPPIADHLRGNPSTAGGRRHGGHPGGHSAGQTRRIGRHIARRTHQYDAPNAPARPVGSGDDRLEGPVRRSCLATFTGRPMTGRRWAACSCRPPCGWRIGAPIDVSAYVDRNDQRHAMKELTRRLLKEIARLGGRPDFEPQLGGRFDKLDA